MYCPKCGNQVEGEARFCDKCGTAIIVEEKTINNSKTQPFHESNISGKVRNRKTKKVILVFFVFLVAIGLVWTGLNWLFNSSTGVSEKLRGNDDRDTSIYVGETAESKIMRISVTDIGYCYLTYDGLFSMELDDNGSRLLYIICDIENLSEQVLNVDSDLFDVYIGSTKCPIFTYCALPDENFQPINRSGSLIPGAKMQLIFSTLLLRSYDNTIDGDLNVMFGNLIIPIADASGWKTTNYRLQPYIDAYNNPESSNLITANTPVSESDIELGAYDISPDSMNDDETKNGERNFPDFSSETSMSGPLMCGTYVYDNGVSAICKADIGFGTEDEELTNSIFIDCWGYGDHEIIFFSGDLEENEDGSYYAYDEGFDASIKVIFADSGFYVEVINSAESLMYELEGFYILEKELNINEVS